MTTTLFNGNVIISGTNGSPPQLAVDDPAGTVRQFQITTDGLARWSLGADSSAEAGANAGSNFFLARYSDSGAYIGVSLEAFRSSGDINVYRSFRGGFDNTLGVLDAKLEWGDQTGWLEGMIPHTEQATRFQSIDIYGQIGGLFATRSVDSANPGGDSTFGIGSFAVNNNSLDVQNVHGIYVEARSTADPRDGGSANVGSTLGIEVALVRSGSPGPVLTPYHTVQDKMTVAYWASSGRADVASSYNASAWGGVYKGSTPTSTAIFFESGLVFDFESLNPNGERAAIHLPSDYNVRWTNRDDIHSDEYDTLVIDGKVLTANVRSNSNGYIFNLINAGDLGADTVVGSLLGVHNYYHVTSGVTEFRVRTAAVKMSADRSAYFIGAVNDANVIVDVTLNARANNCWAPGQDNLLTNGTAGFSWANTFTNAVTLANGVRVASGDPGPNGSVIGSPGDMYLCRTGGPNQTLWIKETGSGTDTGWVAK